MLRALLVVVGALGEAGGCLPCLSSAEQRLGLCRLFLGAASRDHVRCLRRLRQAYAPLDAVAVVEDVWREEGDRVSLRCSLPFPTPPDVVATWGFAKDVRSQDLSLFGEAGVAGGLARGFVIRSAQALQRGTFLCRLHAGAQLLARRYFYLNGQRCIGCGRSHEPHYGPQ
ncbi:sperm acrosome membrane-associated protein 6-like [Alligator mississippiensis]|uniref:Sperm acrosome membrane-associated protein 6-like n=1 Tax=Alligator mississippiensis TaxID=8496 RepID=A0A151M3W8_ALLMI|nr:sperm acrosome membrane-associated protein 6-like [Alligator mississippiensis]